MCDLTNEKLAMTVYGTLSRCWFVCPVCGSRWFGTSGNLRHCNDQFGKACRWRGEVKDSLPDYLNSFEDVFELLEDSKHAYSIEWDGTSYEVEVNGHTEIGSELSTTIAKALYKACNILMFSGETPYMAAATNERII